ncbi:efflux RND transporter permease subunit [Desulfosarcina ovata]|uniref:Multidrug resistance protein n=1 Tax=Desulfosarcina ovata subsp. ovata TaxID=2752305 RepID=A0A5K8AAE8_9BACT|nr:efflux RND transporter permease subunit [Desulfosarcina ovata]BBO89438.1 multidrug resistance protein [Desulfosarcina ovata subsp. ovata]
MDRDLLGPETEGDRRKSGPIAWMAGHTVAANLLMVVFLVGGLIFSRQIKKEVFPDFELDIVTVYMAYPGASPEEVERGIVLAVEEAIQGIDDIKEVTAVANEGSATVTVEVVEGKNIQRVAQDIQNSVDRITSFPDEAEDARVTVTQRRRYVVSLALFGNPGERILRETAEMVRDRLLQDPGITQVDLSGIRDYEISISVPQATLRAYGLTLEGVAAVIRRAAIELPGGSIKTDSGDVLVRMTERRDFGPQFARIPIITANDGTQVLLGDIADVVDGFEDTDSFATYNGQRAILIDVYRVGEQTPLAVSDAVRRKLVEIRPDLPPGIDLVSRNDRSDIYRQRMDLMLRNGYFGLTLVFILLAIFLEPRLAFWVSLGIPISILGSLFFLPAAGVSINIMSMFAFIITLGIVVDDAIVAGENMYHHRQAGKSWIRAAVAGTREIAMPVTFSVLTNIVAFAPLFFVSGIMGKIFRQIPVVVVAVFAVSLVESLLILPAHIGHRKPRSETGLFGWILRQQERFSHWFSRLVRTRYGPFLDLALRQRFIVICIAITVLMLTVSYIKSGRMGFELFPKIESDYALATAVLPYGSAVHKTEAVQQMLVASARQLAAENGGDRLVEGVFADIDGNQARVRIYLTPPDVRPVSTARLTTLWRERVGPVTGLESLKFESDAGGPGRGAAISVELSHRRVDVLARASAEVAETLRFFANVSDIDDGYSPGKRQLDFKIRPEARSLGLRAQDVARQLRYAYYGAEALRQQRGRNEVKVMVRLPKSERISEHHLEEMILRTPAGKEIPLLEAVDIQQGRAYTSIDRRNGRRVITVSADVRPRSQADRVMGSLMGETLPALQEKYPGLTYSFEGRQADRRESMQSLMTGLVFALMVIYAMLAVPFNSFVQPLIIMISIPFGIVGAVIGHMIMGYSLSVMSMFGVVALSGVVINDSLVLIDFANRRRLGGISVHDAIQQAGIVRFRPILLTTLTTFGGLAPMIFETSRQARFLIPMALSLGFGILFATVITLVLVPCFFVVVEDLRRALGLAQEQPEGTSEVIDREKQSAA